MDLDYFEKFIKQGNTNEVLHAKLINRDDLLIAMFFIDHKIPIENSTSYNKKTFLRKKYKSLVDLFFINQNEICDKKMTIIIKPEFDQK